MIFWDTSALIYIFLPENKPIAVKEFFEQCDREKCHVWTLTSVEFVSALYRLKREGQLDANKVEHTTLGMTELFKSMNVVDNIEDVKQRACRLLRTHPLKAADAMQLAAALCASLENPVGKTFVTLDSRLGLAASREGFTIYPPLLA